MKNLLITLVIMFATASFSFGQAKIKVEYEGVTINNTSQSQADPSAVLDVDASNKGVVFPRLTTEQRDQIASPTRGLLIYNLTSDNYEFFNGTTWMGMALVPGDPGTGGSPPPDPTLIANGYEGTLASGVAIAFEAANSEFIEIPELTLSGDFTICYNAELNYGCAPLSDANSSNHYLFHQGTAQARLRVGGINYIIDHADQGGVNRRWVWIRNGSNLKVYADNVLMGSVPCGTGDVTINSTTRLLSTYYNLDSYADLKILDLAFNTENVGFDFHNPQSALPTGIPRSNLLRHYRLSETTTPNNGTILDYSNNKQHGYFHTTATQPSNAAVTGITAGYQTALGNFNRYEVETSTTGINETSPIDFNTVSVLKIRGKFFVPYSQQEILLSAKFNQPYGLTTLNIDKLDFRFQDTVVGQESLRHSELIKINEVNEFEFELNANTNVVTATLNGIVNTQTASNAINLSYNQNVQLQNNGQFEGIPIELELEADNVVIHQYTNVGGWIDEIGSNDAVRTAPIPNQINIYGQDHNSSTDIFGNPFQYEWKEGMLNFVGGNHNGLDAGSEINISGELSIFWAVKLEDFPLSLAKHALFKDDNTEGFTMGVGTNSFVFNNREPGTLNRLYSQLKINNSGSDYEYRFIGVYRKSSGLTSMWIGDESNSMTLDTSDFDLGVPGTNSNNLYIGTSNGGDLTAPMQGMLIPPIIKNEQLTVEDFNYLRQYFLENVINP